jgi:hypothetical protein
MPYGVVTEASSEQKIGLVSFVRSVRFELTEQARRIHHGGTNIGLITAVLHDFVKSENVAK